MAEIAKCGDQAYVGEHGPPMAPIARLFDESADFPDMTSVGEGP